MNRRELLKTAAAGAMAALPGTLADSPPIHSFVDRTMQTWVHVVPINATCAGRKIGIIDAPLTLRLDCADGTATLAIVTDGEWIEMATGPEAIVRKVAKRFGCPT